LSMLDGNFEDHNGRHSCESAQVRGWEIESFVQFT
jgi:hypothetical protein